MAATLTIRLAAEDRVLLEAAARERGIGLSAYVRELAEQEARRRRNDQIRAEGEAVVAHLAGSAAARDELGELGTPQSYLG